LRENRKVSFYTTDLYKHKKLSAGFSFVPVEGLRRNTHRIFARDKMPHPAIPAKAGIQAAPRGKPKIASQQDLLGQ